MQTNTVTYSPADPKFSREDIYVQLHKIFLDARFVGSDILKRFLTFIVDQTLMGHSDWLKEYTIGVKVLNKPIDFKPQESGIVRIHAGRLRRALHYYYQQAGCQDSIYISIPKGGYVPTFSNNGEVIEDSVEEKPSLNKSVVIGVLPFNHMNDNFSNSFADGLCMQLSNGLMHFEKFSVVAYHLMRNLFQKDNDIKEIASMFDVQYIIAGNIQSTKDRIRINIEMIEWSKSRQVWSYMYEKNFSEADIFELQDEVANLIIADLNSFCSLKNTKASNLLAIA